ncbi:ETS-related transcription factor Elf-4-like isoform X1 [Clytia hemisphaerica]|uniref:ETS domain-containing protein n=1 Tax=Clytia hemisphaerica TaxID=252671 RepID=A0A7M5WU26_9CNID
MAPIDYDFTMKNEFLDMGFLCKLLNGRSSSTSSSLPSPPAPSSIHLGSPYMQRTYSKLSSISSTRTELGSYIDSGAYGPYSQGSTGSPSTPSDVEMSSYMDARRYGSYTERSTGSPGTRSESGDSVFSPYEEEENEDETEYFQDNDNDSFCDDVLNEIMFSPSGEVDVMHQKFFEDSLFKNEFDDNQATLNLPNQPGENSNLQQQQIASSPPSVQTNTIYHFPADTKEGIIPKPTPPSNNNNDSESTNLSTSRTSKRMQQKSYSTLKTNSKQNPGKKNKRRRRKNLLKPGSQLYQFILQLLDDESKRELIRWEKPRSTGIFRIINKEQVSQLWGDARKRTMTYDSLSRGLRHYYSQGLLNAVNKKLHYQFTQKALDEWEVIRHKDLIEER